VLARILAAKPDVVLMDEPFSGLHTVLRDEVRGTTRQRRKEAGATVIMVTHDPDEAMRVGDRVALMRGGRLVQTGNAGRDLPAPRRSQAAALFGGATVFHARITKCCVVSPFGQTPTKSVAEGAWAEVLYRSASVRVADKGIPTCVLTVRPYAGQPEDEEAILGSVLPEGVEAPSYVRAAAAMSTALTPGADIHLAAAPEDAFVFPCRDEICRS
jgi:iron(III) transport system ATP-binding protein